MFRKWSFILVLIMCLSMMGCVNFGKLEHNKNIKIQQREIPNEILSYIIKQDKMELYSMFSQEIKEVYDIEEELNIMFNNIPIDDFDVSQAEGHTNGEEIAYGDDGITELYFGYVYEYIYDSYGQEYIISFTYTSENQDNPDSIGIESLRIASIERTNPNNRHSFRSVESFGAGLID